MAGRRRASDWEEEAPKDLDPEAEAVEESENESGSGESEDENAGTEHYVTVGKSKLREKESISLGPQYRGARVSRDALNDSSDDSDVFEDAQEQFDSNDEEFDDPETADLSADEARAGDEDFEIDSDNAFGESDEEKLGKLAFRGSSLSKGKKGGRKNKRPTAADFISDEEEGEDSMGEEAEEGTDLDSEDSEGSEGSDDEMMEGFEDEEDDEEDDGDSDDESADDVDSDSDDSGAKPRGKPSNKADARAEQRKLMNEGQKALAETLSAAAQQDAQKGVAVREQRKTFDGLLNIRIRLQKALVATNSFSAVDDDEEQSSEPYEAAEEAALKLLNTLDSFRASLLPSELAQTGQKRKRGEVDASASNEVIWEGIQEAEQRALKYRKKVLETWSNKTRSATVEVKSRNLVSTGQSIVDSLEEQLLNADRLIKRTRTPRSCAPAQVAKKVNEDPEIYDDADFYQLMLKELVEQRTADNGSTGATAQPTVRWAAMKEAKTKKHVDRRASKGRKMRFNVHEKLQNFMAPEDRRMWEQEAIDRLFGTLFGQKMELSEQASDDEMDDGGVDAEEAGLRLFRS